MAYHTISAILYIKVLSNPIFRQGVLGVFGDGSEISESPVSGTLSGEEGSALCSGDTSPFYGSRPESHLIQCPPATTL